eukprot:m.317136 g.317136  ORF g.317136 m.317136 type:complete len:88 (-) comp55469_c0_seq11:3111-3374(-)
MNERNHLPPPPFEHPLQTKDFANKKENGLRQRVEIVILLGISEEKQPSRYCQDLYHIKITVYPSSRSKKVSSVKRVGSFWTSAFPDM